MNIIHKVDLGNTVIAAGHHDGYDIDPSKLLFAKEIEILNELSPRKRSEWIASRELLFTIAKLPERVECLYDDFGKPFLAGSTNHISLTHSAMWASAMISDRSCGVDIQTYSKTIERIANKFASEDEIKRTALFDDKLKQLHVLWGAKECIYKAYGKRKLEFKQHIHIESIHPGNCTGKGELRFEDIHLFYEIHFRLLPETAWVFCILLPPASPISL